MGNGLNSLSESCKSGGSIIDIYFQIEFSVGEFEFEGETFTAELQHPFAVAFGQRLQQRRHGRAAAASADDAVDGVERLFLPHDVHRLCARIPARSSRSDRVLHVGHARAQPRARAFEAGDGGGVGDDVDFVA